MKKSAVYTDVIPAQAGIQNAQNIFKNWIPACAGMTIHFHLLCLII